MSYSTKFAFNLMLAIGAWCGVAAMIMGAIDIGVTTWHQIEAVTR